MKIKKGYLVPLTLLFLMATLALSSESQTHTKAILNYQAELGFQLSPLALKSIGIQSQPWEGSDRFVMSLKSLVFYRDEIGLYRERGHWLKLIRVKLLKKHPETAEIVCSTLKKGDRIVTEGIALLRVAELDAAGGTQIGDDD